MNAYRVEVTREDGWWMIRVPEFDLLTQADHWGEVEAMARDLIAIHFDWDLSTVAVDITVLPDPETRRLLGEAQDKVAEAERLKAEALVANQSAARRMHDDGWSYRLIGKAMRLTHQRAEQLVKGRR